jgi:hypothetical protein
VTSTKRLGERAESPCNPPRAELRGGGAHPDPRAGIVHVPLRGSTAPPRPRAAWPRRRRRARDVPLTARERVAADLDRGQRALGQRGEPGLGVERLRLVHDQIARAFRSEPCDRRPACSGADADVATGHDRGTDERPGDDRRADHRRHRSAVGTVLALAAGAPTASAAAAANAAMRGVRNGIMLSALPSSRWLHTLAPALKPGHWPPAPSRPSSRTAYGPTRAACARGSSTRPANRAPGDRSGQDRVPRQDVT